MASTCATLATADILKSQNCKYSYIVRVRGKPNSLALTTVDSFSGIVTTSIDASLKGVAPLSRTFQQAYGRNALSALDADATADKQ